MSSPRDDAGPPDPLLTPDDVARWLGKPKATLYAWRSRGLGPRGIRVGNALRYRRKHYRPGARAVYRVALAAGMALRLAILPLRRRLPRPRPEAARAYRAVLARALGRRAEEERKP